MQNSLKLDQIHAASILPSRAAFRSAIAAEKSLHGHAVPGTLARLKRRPSDSPPPLPHTARPLAVQVRRCTPGGHLRRGQRRQKINARSFPRGFSTRRCTRAPLLAGDDAVQPHRRRTVNVDKNCRPRCPGQIGELHLYRLRWCSAVPCRNVWSPASPKLPVRRR